MHELQDKLMILIAHQRLNADLASERAHEEVPRKVDNGIVSDDDFPHERSERHRCGDQFTRPTGIRVSFKVPSLVAGKHTKVTSLRKYKYDC
jgi:hypothetical protein